MTLAASTRYYPLLEALMLKAIPAKIRKLQAYHYNTALEKTHRRMNLEKEREDFMTGVFKNNPNFEKMSLEEVESTFSILIIAGSETTGTTLCGITNELVQNPEELRKLVKEVRSAFISESEMTFEALRNLPFLNAVIHEGLRLCNPIPAGLPRIVPQGGGTVCGYFLPENTHVTVNPSALAFNDKNFARSTSFLPDRYLPDSLRPIEFAADQRSNQQPFGLGPRNCIGKAMAWAEMRVVLAKMVWTFDLEPAPGHRLDWSKQKTYIVVQKEPVNILLKSAKR
ncbi:hypothetical protein MMC15_001667 [Xylographa vitiligo]|nr:hypothetical protein [Xylographa vitiligo]